MESRGAAPRIDSPRASRAAGILRALAGFTADDSILRVSPIAGFVGIDVSVSAIFQILPGNDSGSDAGAASYLESRIHSRLNWPSLSRIARTCPTCSDSYMSRLKRMV